MPATSALERPAVDFPDVSRLVPAPRVPRHHFIDPRFLYGIAGFLVGGALLLTASVWAPGWGKMPFTLVVPGMTGEGLRRWADALTWGGWVACALSIPVLGWTFWDEAGRRMSAAAHRVLLTEATRRRQVWQRLRHDIDGGKAFDPVTGESVPATAVAVSCLIDRLTDPRARQRQTVLLT